MGKKDNLRKNIYYIGFYSFSGGTLEKENRVYSSAAVNLMNFISQKLSSNATVNIISPSWTNNQRGIYRGKKVQLSDNVFLNIAPSVGTYFGLGKFLSIIISQIWLIFKIIFTIKERDKVIVYHSVAFAPVILITKKLFSYKLILQLNEVYQDVKSQGLIKNYFEKAIIRDAGAYIVSNHFLKERMKSYNKEVIICEGVLRMNKPFLEKFSDGKIHLIYAGLIDKIKNCSFNAIAIAPFLSEKYVIHIAGFGSELDVADLLVKIKELNIYSKCQIVFEGFLEGSNLFQFLQKCHIGLVAQSPDQKFTYSSFPSKIYTYLTNNLIVLSLSNSLILSSPVSNLIFTYEKNDPSHIAEVIANIDYKKNHSGEYTTILDSIEVNFNNELLLLVA